MRIPLHIKCRDCEHPQYVWIRLRDGDAKVDCPNCKVSYTAMLMTSITLGHKLLYRSAYELLETEDYPLSIVFSAAAFECEVSRLNKKWFSIDKLNEGIYLEDKDIDPLLRDYRTVASKIKATAEMMHPDGFENFAKNSQDIWQTIEDGFPALNANNLIHAFVENLFWKRNAILHSAKSDYSKEEATSCHNTAKLGLFIMREMDAFRRKKEQ